MNYLLLVTSITSMVLNNSLMSRVSKTMLSGRTDVYRYNALSYIICIALFGAMTLGGSISLYTVILGVLFGTVTLLSNFYRTLALAKGPTHITILITTSSMIIPTLSGVVMGLEEFRPLKLVAMAVLIFFIYLSAKKDEGTSIGKGWLLLCMLAFLFQGIIGVIQKIHQSSEHKAELFPFLFVSFTVSFLFATVMGYTKKTETKFGAKHFILSAISGICIFTMNVLNLKLSGLLPSQLFFPAVNGTAIIFTSLVAVLLFKEKLSKRQFIGIAGGLLSLVAICVL
ncbi:MAG: EamA family transporter [Clostridia bacterium]|nr:EamA family transporter [Clostridia bacterium]